MKIRRLQTQPQFQALLKRPPVARSAHFALHSLALQPLPAVFPAGGVWLGAMTPKRWAKRAVTRNLIRRQIYGIGEQRTSAQDAAYLVRLRAGYDLKQFPSAASQALRSAVRAEIEMLFAQGQGRAK